MHPLLNRLAPWGLAFACASLGCSSDPATAPTTAPPRCEPFGTVDEAAFADLRAQAGTPDDGPFYMLNLIQFRELACYEDGRETDLTGREADALYAPIEFLFDIGAAPVFVASEDTTLLGDGTTWDQVAIVEYPSAEAFFTMVDNPEFQARAIHKDAGVGRTIVMRAKKLPAQLPDNLVDESPYPATAEDPAREIVHLMKFRDEAEYPPGTDYPPATGEEAVALYSENAGETAGPLGVYPTAWFDIDAVMIGDGRDWDQLRLNHMPSLAAFQALVDDPDRQEGQVHREAGLEDTYTVLTTPVINSLAPR